MNSRRLHLKRRKKSNPISFLLGTIFFSFILTIIIIFKAGKHLEESITSYASIETKRVATSILNDVIRNDDFTIENLYKIVKNDSKEIEFIDYNSK